LGIARLSPVLNLLSDETRVSVRTNGACRKALLLPDNTSRFNAREYHVQSRADSRIFCEFVKSEEGTPIQMTKKTIHDLRALSEAFGFDTLTTECDPFMEPFESVSEDSQSTQSSSIRPQICDLQERFLLLKGKFESEILSPRCCEYVFGSNGYGDQGEELSKDLGVIR
jgi:hypothetical protein